MSIINAIVEVRTFRNNGGPPELKECCRVLRATPGAAATFDYTAVADLEESVHLFAGAIVAREQMLRETLEGLILHFRPQWGLLLQHGTQRFSRSVSPEIKQCFESAGIFKDVADPDSILWWDKLAEFFRSGAVVGQITTGRRGEMLTMSHEGARLTALGHAGMEPFWVALQDETLGYDVLSCDLSTGVARSLYIEVKASELKPFVFFISDKEWEFALRCEDPFVFHFWYVPGEELRVVTVDQIAPHIPVNNGAGVWKKVQIPWFF
jgi:hypothetical protein